LNVITAAKPVSIPWTEPRTDPCCLALLDVYHHTVEIHIDNAQMAKLVQAQSTAVRRLCKKSFEN